MNKGILYILVIISGLLSCHKHENASFTEHFNSQGDWQFTQGDIYDTAFISNQKLTLMAETGIFYEDSYAEAKLPLLLDDSDKICFRIHFDEFGLSGGNSEASFTNSGSKGSYLRIQVGNLEIRNIKNMEEDPRILGDSFIDIEINVKKKKLKVKKNGNGDNITDYFTINEVSSFDNYITFGAMPVFSPSLGWSFPTTVQVSSFEIFLFD